MTLWIRGTEKLNFHQGEMACKGGRRLRAAGEKDSQSGVGDVPGREAQANRLGARHISSTDKSSMNNAVSKVKSYIAIDSQILWIGVREASKGICTEFPTPAVRFSI